MFLFVMLNAGDGAKMLQAHEAENFAVRTFCGEEGRVVAFESYLCA